MSIAKTAAPSPPAPRTLPRIPFNRPFTAANQVPYLLRAMEGGHLSGDGAFTRAASARLSAELNGATVLLTTSCTHALEMAALLLDVQPGDEVITTPFTFVSTVNAFVLRGARPVFVDVRPDTLNLDERALAAAITPRTRAIVPVHYAGVACEMDAICAIANEHGIAVVEDNAHGMFGRYKGRPLGTFGALATQSFHETKNVSCGEGGALVVNDPRLVERAEILREKGTNRAKFFRGAVDKYTWVDVGSSYLLSELNAAVLAAQLDDVDVIQRRRMQIWNEYDARLAAWSALHGVRRPIVPAECEHPAHLYYLLLPSLRARTALLAHLRERDVLGVFHYVPLHRSPMGETFAPAPCPVAEDVADRLVRLPLFVDLDESLQEEVIEAILSFDPSAHA